MPARASTVVEISTKGLDSFSKRVGALARSANLSRPSFKQACQPILKELESINENDRLKGLDRFGKPLQPVTYRPKGQVDKKRSNSPKRAKFSKRNAYGNLTSTEYRKLDGPPLAPRRKGSRVISNYVTGMEFARGQWRVRAGWKDFLDNDGRPLLPVHLRGGPGLPKRDIAGLSRKALKRLREVALQAIREGKSDG